MMFCASKEGSFQRKRTRTGWLETLIQYQQPGCVQFSAAGSAAGAAATMLGETFRDSKSDMALGQTVKNNYTAKTN